MQCQLSSRLHTIYSTSYKMLNRVCRTCASTSRLSRVYILPNNLDRGPFRYNSTTSTSSSTSTSTSAPTSTKRPSPYRLIPVSTFLADFAPLHVKGWRLDNLPHLRHASSPKEGGMVELQDRHLTRRYDFGLGREGWGEAMRFVQSIGEAIAIEDVS